MNIRKYHAFEEDEEEGFERSPYASQELVVQPNHTIATLLSLEPPCPNPHHRYSSSEKPSFKLSPLERPLLKLKGSQELVLRRSSPAENQNQSNHEREEQGRPIRRTVIPNQQSLSTLESIMEAVIVKSTRTEIAEDLSVCFDPRDQEEIVKEECSLGHSVVYRSTMLTSTHAYFQSWVRQSSAPSFLSSKYNLALKLKMQKAALPKPRSEPLIINDSQIEFRSDFQSGNLDLAVQKEEDEFNLHVRIDTNTRGHRSWFYFQVNNRQDRSRTLRINLCNLGKRFRLITQGQKVYLRQDHHQEWRPLPGEVRLLELGRRKFQLSFELEIGANQKMEVSLLPPYTYSQLLKDVEEFESSPNVRVDILGHSVTGLAIPLLTVSKGAAKERKNKVQARKRVVLISGRIHPSETCSSFIIRGLIRELISNDSYDQLLTNTVFKIVPMLNPDGVVFGNFRTNYLGDDLNRAFSKTDEALFPEVVALKELGRTLKNIYGDSFIGFLDLHGHSSQPSSFVYGPEHEEGSQQFVECRVLAKILERVSPYFRYESCLFRLEPYKFNTARGFFLKKLGVTAYTIETSYALYLDKEQQQLRPLGPPQWHALGQQITSALFSYLLYRTAKSRPLLLRRPKEQLREGRTKETNSQEVDFDVLRKQIAREEKKTHQAEAGEEDSDGEDQEEDLPEQVKNQVLRKYREATAPGFFLPKVPKAPLALPSVVPSILKVGRGVRVTSTMPKLMNRFRQKKPVRPLNLSYEYTQYLLKNISQLSSLRPEVINFGSALRNHNQHSVFQK